MVALFFCHQSNAVFYSIHCYISFSYILTVRFRYNMVTSPCDTYSTCVAHSGRWCVYLCGVYGLKVWQSMPYVFRATLYTNEWCIRSSNFRNRFHWCYMWSFIRLLVSCVVEFLSLLLTEKTYLCAASQYVYVYINMVRYISHIFCQVTWQVTWSRLRLQVTCGIFCLWFRK